MLPTSHAERVNSWSASISLHVNQSKPRPLLRSQESPFYPMIVRTCQTLCHSKSQFGFCPVFHDTISLAHNESILLFHNHFYRAMKISLPSSTQTVLGPIISPSRSTPALFPRRNADVLVFKGSSAAGEGKVTPKPLRTMGQKAICEVGSRD